MMNGEQVDGDPTLTLEEFTATVVGQLEERGLTGAARDGRVSPVPDPRTIRYYTSLGLLDRPTVRNRQALYGRRHILQLLAVKALQATALPLAEIQASLYARSNDELEALLATAPTTWRSEPTAIKTVRWREVTIEPGLRVVAEENWSPGMDPAALEERLRAAITALKARPEPGGRKD